MPLLRGMSLNRCFYTGARFVSPSVLACSPARQRWGRGHYSYAGLQSEPVAADWQTSHQATVVNTRFFHLISLKRKVKIGM